jgi:trehalose 6-phosphate phosphatase
MSNLAPRAKTSRGAIAGDTTSSVAMKPSRARGDKYSFEGALDACLDALRHRPSGLVTDVDGTISPIALDPAESFVLPGCRNALATLRDTLDFVGVLTGREPQVARQLVGLEGIEYFGTHGMVRWTDEGPLIHPDAGAFVDRVSSIASYVRERLQHDGILVEQKGPTMAVHYRQTRNPLAVRQIILQEIGPLANEVGMALFEGRMVIELRPPPPLGKGWTIEDIACNRDLHSLIYLGDDRTDIEAFDAIRAWRDEAPGRHGIALAVASPEMPTALVYAADYVLDEVPAVELLLTKLALALRIDLPLARRSG